MLAFLAVIAIGSSIGFARGGSFRAVEGARLRLLPLVFGALGLQVIAQVVPQRTSMLAYGLVIASYAALFAFAGANWRIPGMAFVAIGAAMNYVVILANQGMPITAEAAARAGFTGEAAARLVLRGKHFIAAAGESRLTFLGDIIPLWRQPAVASAGDLVIWSGLALVLQSLMRGPRGRRTHVDSRDAYEFLPDDHVGSNPGDTMLAEIDLRDEGVHMPPTGVAMPSERLKRARTRT